MEVPLPDPAKDLKVPQRLKTEGLQLRWRRRGLKRLNETASERRPRTTSGRGGRVRRSAPRIIEKILQKKWSRAASKTRSAPEAASQFCCHLAAGRPPSRHGPKVHSADERCPTDSCRRSSAETSPGCRVCAESPACVDEAVGGQSRGLRPAVGFASGCSH